MLTLVRSRCSCCHEVKPTEEFAADSSSKWGRKSYCLICDRIRQRRRYVAAKAAGKKRVRRPAAKKSEAVWPLPTHTIQDGLACVQLRKWRGPVSAGLLRGAL